MLSNHIQHSNKNKNEAFSFWLTKELALLNSNVLDGEKEILMLNSKKRKRP